MVRIQSKLVKRLELEHIEDSISMLNVIPDFGYPLSADYLKDSDEAQQEDKGNFRGWDLLRDYVQNGSRYERLHNYIEMV